MNDFLRKYQRKEVVRYPNSVYQNPFVTVSIITYNQVNFIQRCLEGVLNQKTNFPFEVLLGDDGSTDGTREICLKYARNYPETIRFFLHHRENNIKINGEFTGRFNVIYNFISARGTYIALCEGDDLWTDPFKLQKQVDFLDENKDYGICFHNVTQKNLFTSQSSSLPGNDKDIIFDLKDYILSNRTATCSIMFVKEKLGDIPEWFTTLPFGDLGLILIVMINSNKKGMVLKENMALYRIHHGGMHGSLLQNDLLYIQAYKRHLQFLRIIDKNLLKHNYKSALIGSYIYIYKELLRLHGKNGNKFFVLKTNFHLYLCRLQLKMISR